MRSNFKNKFTKIFKSSCGLIAKELNRSLEISEFDLQACYDSTFQSNTLGNGISPTQVRANIILLLSFYKDDFGIR